MYNFIVTRLYYINHIVCFQESKCVIKQTFATKSHTGSIRAVACCERFLASAGSDDRIFIYDMNTRKEVQMLIHHSGTVNTIAFTPKASHILSGGADGALAIVRTGNWQTEKLWGSAHKKSAVNHVAVHPSGKLALSIGADHVLRTWNLVKGRHAYATNLSSRGPHGLLLDSIHWSKDGSHFTLAGSRKLDIWSIEHAAVIDSQELDSKMTSCYWITETKLVCGLEDGNILIYDTKNKSKHIEKGHNCRIKCVAGINMYIVTCDSSGVIKLWINDDNDDIQEMCSTNASCRITCITLVDNRCLKKEEVENKGELNVLQNEQSSDNESLNMENENKPKNLKKRGQVVVIEEEINEVKISTNENEGKRKLKTIEIEEKAVPHKKQKKKKCDSTIRDEAEQEFEHESKLSENLDSDIDQSSEKVTKKQKKKKSKNEKNAKIDTESSISKENTIEDVNGRKKSKKDRNIQKQSFESKISHSTNVEEHKVKKKCKPNSVQSEKNAESLLEISEIKIAKKKKAKTVENSSIESTEAEQISNMPIKIKKKKHKMLEDVESNNENEITNDIDLPIKVKKKKKDKKMY